LINYLNDRHLKWRLENVETNSTVCLLAVGIGFGNTSRIGNDQLQRVAEAGSNYRANAKPERGKNLRRTAE
jgi:hypothetical protein